MTTRHDGITLADGTRPSSDTTKLDGRIFFTDGDATYNGEFEILNSGWIKFVNDNDVLILLPPHAVAQVEVQPQDRKEQA